MSDVTTSAETSRSERHSSPFGIAEMLVEAVGAIAKLPSTVVYSGYLTSRIKRALRETDPSLSDGQIITAVSDIETIGDCRYAVKVTDHLNNSYRVTVEVFR